MGHDMAMLRILLLLALCLAIAVLVGIAIRNRGTGGKHRGVLNELADRSIELALNHRELDSDRELASAVLKRSVKVDARLPGDLLLLAEAHMDASPSLAWAIADAARSARKQLP